MQNQIPTTEVSRTFNIRILIILLIVIGAISAGYFGWEYLKSRPVSNEFVGPVEKIEDNIIFAKGNFIVEGHNEFLGQDKSKEVKITVASGTKIIRTLLEPPTEEQLGPGGIFYPEDLKRDVKEVDLSALNSDLQKISITIKVKSNKNILNKDVIEASEISYTLMNYFGNF